MLRNTILAGALLHSLPKSADASYAVRLRLTLLNSAAVGTVSWELRQSTSAGVAIILLARGSVAAGLSSYEEFDVLSLDGTDLLTLANTGALGTLQATITVDEWA